MVLTTLAALVGALPGQFSRFAYGGLTTRNWFSYWLQELYPVPPGADPTAISGGGVVPTSASPGALDLRNAGSGNQLYLYSIKTSISNTNMKLILADRLWHGSGVVGNSIVAQDVVSAPALTRPDDNGYDAELWLEINSAWGGTATVLTASYTDPVNGAGRTATCTIGANSALSEGIMWPFTLQTGDTGVASVQSVTLGTSTGSAGNASLVILRRVGSICLNSNSVPYKVDPLIHSLPPIYNGACLFFFSFNDGSNSNGALAGEIQIVEG